MKATPGSFGLLAAVVLALALSARTTHAADVLVFSDTNTDLGVHFNPAASEIGDEITLAPGGRFVTSFNFQYWASGGAFTNGEMAEVKFYRNDGALSAGYPGPGALLYDSGTFSIAFGATAGSTLVFNQTDLNGGVIVPDDFTWSVQFSGLDGGENVGVELYDPPSIGTDFTDYWLNTGGTWTAETNADYALNFGAQFVVATPEPASGVLLGLGGLLAVAAGRCFRRKR